MLNVALTGNVASGKSTVAEAWAAAGVPVVSADDLARHVVEPGTPGLDEVREAFGEEILAADGTLDRGRLRERILADPADKERLEAILHPRIQSLRDVWVAERRAEGARLVVSEIPLLFEVGLEDRFDVTVLVDAAAEIRHDRLVSLRGMRAEEAGRLMAAQMDPSIKRARADHVLDNDGPLEALHLAAARLLSVLRERAGVGSLRLDLHVHTAGSYDCLSDPHEVLARARALGYGRVAVTDHNRLEVALRLADAEPERVIPGEEVRTREGVDVIGLYLSREIPKGTPARETVERIHDQGGVSYLPHPYAPGKGGGGRMADELAPLCDVVEVFNARLHDPRANRLARTLAGRHGRLAGAGSDAHTLAELGNAWIEVPAHPNEPGALRVALAAGMQGGRTASRLVHLASTWAKVRKKLPGGVR